MRGLGFRLFKWWCAFVARCFESRDHSQIPIGKLKNINPWLTQELEKIGIKTRTDLIELGALETYHRLLQAKSRVSHNALLRLHGAITDQPIEEISDKEVAYLLEEAQALTPLLS